MQGVSPAHIWKLGVAGQFLYWETEGEPMKTAQNPLPNINEIIKHESVMTVITYSHWNNPL